MYEASHFSLISRRIPENGKWRMENEKGLSRP
jgi:hypothetical protein